MVAAWMTNIYVWMGMTFFFLLGFILLMILLIILSKKTHAMVEFKAWMKGKPICMFFQENRYVHWEPMEPEAGIITHKNYGAFIVNEKATYIDKRTKNVIIPFDAAFGASVNIHAAKLADDLQYLIKDEESMSLLREAIATNQIDANYTIDCLKTSVHIGALKTMMTALLPHNINSKIEKILAQRMKGWGNVNHMQIIIIFCAILGAILIGYLIIRLAVPHAAAT